MACSPAPKAHSPGALAGARASARAWPDCDCALNSEGWQDRQDAEPAYWPIAVPAKHKASTPPVSPRQLPDEAAAILELTPVNPGLLRRDATEGGSPGDVQVRIGAREAVGDVIALEAQLEFQALLDGEHFRQSHVHIDEARPLNVVIL